jgi:PKD repeat protein
MIKISLMPGTYYVMIEAYDFAAEIPVYWLELNYSYNMNEPPSAYIEMYPWNPAVGVPMTFSGQNSYDADGYITSYEWSFSDGTTDSGAVVNHTFYAEGVYNITLVVTDDDGATGWSNVGVWVNQNDPPVVNFSYYPANPTLYQYVTFSGWGSYDPDGYIQYYIWTVDNTTQYWTYNPQMDYYFTTPGDHVVTLTAFDNMGASASMSLIVHINEPPVAVITVSPDVGKVGGVCTFDASGSYDPEGGPLTYEWNFGDGMNYTDPVVNYVFYTAGLHTVYLYVVDSVGSWAYTQISYVVVNPMPPLAIISYSPSRPAVGQQVTFDGFASVDPDGSIATYIWQFGDGVVAFGQVATHAYEHAGVYTVKLTVMDEDNLVDDDVGTITVASAPVAAFEHIPISPAAGEVANFFAYGSSDESGLVSYEWSFGDGYYANGWQAPHAFASAGSYTVKLTVTNTYGVKATATQVVVVGAAGPTLAALPGLTGGNGWTADTSAGSNAGMSASASSELLDGVVLMTFGLAMLACVLARQRVRK